MSHTRGQLSLKFVCLAAFVSFAVADISVSVNVNKPVHDTDEQFVSFAINPELLFKSLDGPNKKTLSDMAALLGPSYLKLTGDYFFPSDLKSNLKNPTQSIWSGFNRWTRAMNWTMIIPVQYTPMTWDPIEALRVLNTSNTVGIENCIWQLGIDFGASRAAEYVDDLNTLDTMVDTFRPYVKSWKVMGADITAGSSPEETKRYIELSSDINTAFGWTQPAAYHIEENINGYIYDKDPSLKVMMEKKIPIWLTLPPKSPVDHLPNGMAYASVEESEGLRWAQTLGDAASSGFDAVFKPLTKDDVKAPNYSFFVSALFKKVMGNRVFPSKPVRRSTFNSKLYTHCANGISGGIAFMAINTEENGVKITAKPSAKFTGSEVWQFMLTSKKGVMFLNNEELALNSTLAPFVRIKHPNKPLAMLMPPMSVGFWVLPLANNEDCQFTELIASHNLQQSRPKSKQRRQTSSSRLLKKLILETSVTDQIKNRRRRDTSSLIRGPSSRVNKLPTRGKRFILQDGKLAVKQSAQERNLKKRENTQNWFKSLMKPYQVLFPGLGPKRKRRDVDFMTALYPSPNKGGKRKDSQPSAKAKKTDETSIFKPSPDNGADELPQGDVHFRYMTGTDGEEVPIQETKEEIDEERETPQLAKELPSEFYETIANAKFHQKPHKSRLSPKAKIHDVSDIDGPTKYMTRKQLQSKFDEIQKQFSKASKSEKISAEEPTPKSFLEPEYTAEANGQREKEPLSKFFYDSNESDTPKSYQPSSKHSKTWEIGERTRRAIGFNKLKSWHENLISDDDVDRQRTYVVPEMIETISQSPTGKTEEKVPSSNLKSHVSKILDAVRNHLTNFFNSLAK